MSSVTLLAAPEYTEEERRALLDFVLALKKTHVQELLKQVKLPRSGAKPDLRERLQDALDDGQLQYGQIVDFLDSVAPWGKQHVFLYSGPRGELRAWKDPNQILQRLKSHHLGKYFNARLPLILPGTLSLSSITHADGKLRVTAVQKQVYSERAPEHDGEKPGKEGQRITLKAYVDHVSRTLAAFEWDLNANVALLQITQLHKDTLYEEVAKEFRGLIAGWLDIENSFGLVDISRAIKKLHELERSGKPEARSHVIHYRTLRGRTLSAQSSSPRDSVLGEAIIDNAMDAVGKTGVGHAGNFYWLPGVSTDHVPNPLQGEVHVIIVGNKSRVNFPTPSGQDAVRYVLHRVRAIS